jgi:hypothetical protein
MECSVYTHTQPDFNYVSRHANAFLVPTSRASDTDVRTKLSIITVLFIPRFDIEGEEKAARGGK